MTNLLNQIFGESFLNTIGGAEFLLDLGFILALQSAYISYVNHLKIEELNLTYRKLQTENLAYKEKRD